MSKPIEKSRLIVLDGNKILVLEKKGMPKRLTLAGGIVKKNESLKEGLIREVNEEIGVKLKKKQLIYFSSHSKQLDDSSLVKHYFFINKEIKDYKLLEPHKFSAVYWIEWSEAIEYMDKLDRKVVKKIFKETYECS